MSKITTTSVLSPKIGQYFDAALLSKPIFQDDSESLNRVYKFIVAKLLKKAKNNPKRLEKCLRLEREFLDLYERAKKKEKDLETKKGHITKEPFYRIKSLSIKDEELYRRFKFRS